MGAGLIGKIIKNQALKKDLKRQGSTPNGGGFVQFEDLKSGDTIGYDKMRFEAYNLRVKNIDEVVREYNMNGSVINSIITDYPVNTFRIRDKWNFIATREFAQCIDSYISDDVVNYFAGEFDRGVRL